MLGILQQLPHEYLQGKSVQHALEVHRALTCGDWQQYSRLFAVGSWQQRCLMHHRLDQVGNIVLPADLSNGQTSGIANALPVYSLINT